MTSQDATDTKANQQIETFISFSTIPRDTYDSLLFIIENNAQKKVNKFDRKTCDIIKVYQMMGDNKVGEIEYDSSTEYFNYYMTTNVIWDTDFIQVVIYLDKPKTEFMGKQSYQKRMYKLVETASNSKFIKQLRACAKEIKASRTEKVFNFDGVDEEESRPPSPTPVKKNVKKSPPKQQ